MYDKDSDYKSYGCVNNNDLPTIEKWYFVEYLIKKGGNGCTKVRAADFGDVERKFAETHDISKEVISTIKFEGIILNGRFYKATENFD